jgi:Nif-specific regulatory protein
MNSANDNFAEKAFKILAKTGEILGGAGSPKTVFANALDFLKTEAGFLRSFIVLFHAQNEKLQPFATNNLSVGEFRRLESKAEKSFIGTVFYAGKAVTIPRTTLEPSFAAAFEIKRQPTSCVCVPIVLANRVLGAFGAEIEYEAERDYQFFTDFLTVLAAMIANALKAERVIASEKEKLLLENSARQRELREKYDFSALVGNSGAMRLVFDQAAQVARTNTPVLLRGENGTGKELIANLLHYNSLRSKKTFVKFDCAALPENLIESELFGKNSKRGKIEIADGGTLFLEEITALPTQTQAKLLRVLESKDFERVGGEITLKANVRLIASTVKNLEELVAAGKFREDLFYRLSVFTIFLPPLRERKSDILLLAEHFVEKYERAYAKRIKRISTPAIDMLTSYHFPGNVRELENVIERAVIVCDSNVIHGYHLPPTLQTADTSGTITRVRLETAVAALEKDLIQDALKTTRGNRAKAAKLLDTTERILCYKINKYNIEPQRFK